MSERDEPPEADPSSPTEAVLDPSSAEAGRAAAVLALTGATLLARSFSAQTENPFALGRGAELESMSTRLRARLDAEPEADAAKALDASIDTLEIAVGGLRLARAGVASLGGSSSVWAAGAASLWSAALAADRAAREGCRDVDEAGFVARRPRALEVLRASADECFGELRSLMETRT